MSFVHLHVHDTYSLLDGFGIPIKMVQRSAEIGLIALAQTNHGTISGHIAHQMACKETGVYPVYGCEFYIVRDMSRRGLTEEERHEITIKTSGKAEAEKMKSEILKGARERSHIVVLAVNDEGYKNLRTLVSLSNLEGFYHKPRIDYKTLGKHKAGLFVSSACIAGDLPKYIINGEMKKAERLARLINETFEGRFAMEIMPLDIDEQRRVNLGIQDLSKTTGIPVIATNDVHYPLEQDAWAQDVLLAIGTNKRFADENRLRFGDGHLFLKSETQMAWAFRKFHPDLDPSFVSSAIGLTYDLAFSFKADPLISIAGLPIFELPENFQDPDEFLRYLCAVGWKKRGLANKNLEIQKTYGDRVKYELGILKEKGFANYFLITWDMVKWAKEHGICVGPARGSSAGSIVAYLLFITEIDPLRFGLSFERFIAPHRKDYPDIDIDFEDLRRNEVREYLNERYGSEHVANVATINVLGFRSAFRDAARAFGVPQQEVNRAIGYFEESFEEENDEIDTAAIEEFGAKYPDVLRATRALQGQIRAGGTHAAGVVISNKPLKEITAIELRESVPVVAMTKDEAETLGLIKFDLLGLRTMTILSWAVNAMNEKRKIEGLPAISVESLTTSLNDPIVFAEFAAGNTDSVFQLNRPGGKRLCQDIQINCFDDLAVVNALDRPGPLQSGGTEIYVKNRKRKMIGPGIHPIFSEITGDTFGVLLYQEQVMRICRELAGLDWPDVHAIRKAIAKSQGIEALESFWQKFKDGAMTTSGCKEATARTIWDMIVRYGGYCFNKCIDIHTQIITMDGVKEAQDLRKGDRILVADPDGLRESEVVDVYDQGFLNGYEATFDDGSKVVCSIEHKFSTDRGDLSLADIIKTGAEVASSEKAKTWGMEMSGLWDNLFRPMGKNGTLQNLSAFSGRTPTNSFSNDVLGLAESSTRFNPRRVGNGEKDIGEARCSGRQSIAPCRMAGVPSGEDEGDHPQDAGREETTCGPILEDRTNNRLLASRLQEEFPNQMHGHGSGSRFCPWESLGRSGRAFPFPSCVRTETPSTILYPRRGVELGSGETWCQANSGGVGMLHGIGGNQTDLQNGRTGCCLQSTAGAYVYRRLISVVPVGPRKMVDIEVRAPHLFALANGLISHNSHAVAYAAISYATMWLKIYYPAEYLCAAMLYGSNPREAVTEARKHGISVNEPNINKSGLGYSIRKRWIYAGLDAAKGIGPVAATEIISARESGPFVDYKDFCSRTGSRKVHKGIIKILIEVGAFESIHRNTEAMLEFHAYNEDSKGKLNLFDTENEERYKKTFPGKSPSIELLLRRAALLPYMPVHHAGLEFKDVLESLDRLYSSRTKINELRIAGRKNIRNETRTITGILMKFEIKVGEFGSRKKFGLAWIEDETGDIVLRMDPKRFSQEMEILPNRIGYPYLAVVSPVSEQRADVREIADLMKFRESFKREYLKTNSMANLLEAPGRIVKPFRVEHRILKTATKIRNPFVVGLVARISSGNSKRGEMGFIELVDETSQQLVLIWPDSWEFLKDKLVEGRIYEASLSVTRDRTLSCDVSRGNYFKEIEQTPET